MWKPGYYKDNKVFILCKARLSGDNKNDDSKDTDNKNTYEIVVNNNLATFKYSEDENAKTYSSNIVNIKLQGDSSSSNAKLLITQKGGKLKNELYDAINKTRYYNVICDQGHEFITSEYLIGLQWCRVCQAYLDGLLKRYDDDNSDVDGDSTDLDTNPDADFDTSTFKSDFKSAFTSDFASSFAKYTGEFKQDSAISSRKRRRRSSSDVAKDPSRFNLTKFKFANDSIFEEITQEKRADAIQWILKNGANKYRCLGFKKVSNLDKSIVQHRFKKLSLLIHPDKAGDLSGAIEAFKCLSAAYSSLCEEL